MKWRGQIRELAWRELLWNLRPGSPIYLGGLPTARHLSLAVTNPHGRPSDVEAGADAFRAECAGCHGAAGRGTGTGPDLTAPAFVDRSTDWSIYRAITRGVPSTAMQPHRLPARTTWQIVAYVRSLAAADSAAARPAVAPPVAVSSADLLRAAERPAHWSMYSGDYRSHRFSGLRQITAANVAALRPLWIYQMQTSSSRVETSPVVAREVLYVTEPPGDVLALDATDGTLLWRYSRPPPADVSACCGLVNRGVAILDSLIYVGTLDAHLLALNARTGALVWDAAVADYQEGYSITAAPLALEDLVVTGVAGGEYGIRGFLDAYDANTGRRRWRFFTVPEPGAPGSETWSGEAWQTGGAPTWLTGSYDPALNLVYWGVGNPSPDFQGAERDGDNLYSNSVIAVDADSGTLRWFFQFTPHDVHDWDAVQIPVLLDAVIDGRERPLMAWANRNAFYYLLDRQTGRFLLARPFARQTWAERIDSLGRPVVRPESSPSDTGSLVFPWVAGATNWWSPSYSPQTELLYVPVSEAASIYFAGPADYSAGEQFLGSASQRASGQPCLSGVRALDPLTGAVRWEHLFTTSKRTCVIGSVLSTAGDLVFAADSNDFVALDARTGAELWRFPTGARIMAAPIAYRADGREIIAVAAGRSILAFGLGSPTGAPRR